MVSPPGLMLTRRAGLAVLGGAVLAPLTAGRVEAARVGVAGAPPVITLLGDSITAGLGLPAVDALPAQIAAALKALKVSAQVRGAGVSGDTTADALARVDFSVQPDTRLCLVALGGNDLLQGIEPAVVKANLTAILAHLKARRIAVVLAGMRAPKAIGSAYAREFDGVFPAVAKAGGAAFYPYLLEGVGGVSRLNQADGIHPNPAGVKIIAAHLAPVLAKGLARTLILASAART